MNIRRAKVEDVETLILIRWEFTLEHQPWRNFLRECGKLVKYASAA